MGKVVNISRYRDINVMSYAADRKKEQQRVSAWRAARIRSCLRSETQRDKEICYMDPSEAERVARKLHEMLSDLRSKRHITRLKVAETAFPTYSSPASYLRHFTRRPAMRHADRYLRLVSAISELADIREDDLLMQLFSGTSLDPAKGEGGSASESPSPELVDFIDWISRRVHALGRQEKLEHYFRWVAAYWIIAGPGGPPIPTIITDDPEMQNACGSLVRGHLPLLNGLSAGDDWANYFAGVIPSVLLYRVRVEPPRQIKIRLSYPPRPFGELEAVDLADIQIWLKARAQSSRTYCAEVQLCREVRLAILPADATGHCGPAFQLRTSAIIRFEEQTADSGRLELRPYFQSDSNLQEMNRIGIFGRFEDYEDQPCELFLGQILDSKGQPFSGSSWLPYQQDSLLFREGGDCEDLQFDPFDYECVRRYLYEWPDSAISRVECELPVGGGRNGLRPILAPRVDAGFESGGLLSERLRESIKRAQLMMSDWHEVRRQQTQKMPE